MTGRPDRIRGGIHDAVPHDSARKHVTGEALFVDDLPEPPGTLFAAVGLAEPACARIDALDLRAVRTAPGVACVIAAPDVPGTNDVGPVVRGDPVFAADRVDFSGQVLFAVAADSIEHARRATRRARVAYSPLEPVLTIDDARARDGTIAPPRVLRRGDAAAAIAGAAHRLSGRVASGAQDHFYLEGQVSLAIPLEDGDLLVHSSTQHPADVQRLVARALGRPVHAVTVEVRRLGGGFGGKETQATQWAAIAALLADRTRRPVKLRLDRDDDMRATGKRHDFTVAWDVGFDGEGRIHGLALDLASRCGHSADLSNAVNDRALLHADNAYHLDAVTVTSHRWRTNTVSSTAFRGFGAPQAMLGIETVLDDVARFLGRDPLDVRRANLYGPHGRDRTPYGMTVAGDGLARIVAELERTSDYRARRHAIAAFNGKSRSAKRGIALTPVKFGIAFAQTHLNQGGALVHVYDDGSIHLSHGGTEMGQGLLVKVAQIVAEELQVDVERVKISATRTDKVPNTSATAASSSTDLNGAAAREAARAIRDRLAACAASHFDVEPAAVRFARGRVHAGDRSMTFGELVRLALAARVSLSATGFHRTPEIGWDPVAVQGRPFLYFACGAAVSEVRVDTLTGEHRLCRVDVLHDCGRSINPAVDVGQIEGGFVQGLGWLTTEEVVWDDAGRLLTHSPSTYKIPTAGDVPDDFRVALFQGGEGGAALHGSKAVGEPPLMLAISVFQALRDAIASVGPPGYRPALDAPATPERVLAAIMGAKEVR